MLGLAWVGLALLPAGPAAANGIRVANVGLTRQDTVAKTARVTFDLAWSNSWRSAESWDAAWVFVKFRAPGSSVWAHATLDTNSSAHLPGGNGAITAAPDGKGVFVYRSANYTGDVNYAGVKLQWDYGTDGQDFAPGTGVDVSVHAIEMVYIPEGPFYLGSGGSETGHFYEYTDGTSITNPFMVSSTNAITVGTSNGNLYYISGSDGDQQGIVSNAFPNGYAAFYCMKYEISQGQYTDFLNKLTTNQAGNRWPNNSGYLYTVSRNAFNFYSASSPDRACNFLDWKHGVAYADWSALRPLTELEFEKACRGAAYPVANEYAWGNATLVQLSSEARITGSGTEIAVPTNANCQSGHWSDAVSGPMRGGIFAARANATRTLSGAGYYGVMELSGNLVERCVTVGTNTGRAFTGLHGDGVLTSPGGDADVPGWPGTSAAGTDYRGGDWRGAERVSGRPSDSTFMSGSGSYGYGFRGARTAP